MKKFLLLPGLMILLLVLFALTKTPPAPTRAKPALRELPLEAAPPATPAAAPSRAAPPRALKAVTARPDEATNVHSTLVEFEIKEGLAVAFGDVTLGQPEEEFVQTQKTRGWVDTEAVKLWSEPRIPYIIDLRIENPKLKQSIEEAIRYFNERTPVQWVPFSPDTDTDAVLFEKGEQHCYSNLGRVGGIQGIRLVPDCGRDEILHEMMHTLGFIHEHSRADRDDFIDVLWDNIDPLFALQFKKAPSLWTEPLLPSSFNYRSIMLYDPLTFAKPPARPGEPPLPTMRSRTGTPLQPSSDGLSEDDFRRIRRLFHLDPDGGGT